MSGLNNWCNWRITPTWAFWSCPRAFSVVLPIEDLPESSENSDEDDGDAEVVVVGSDAEGIASSLGERGKEAEAAVPELDHTERKRSKKSEMSGASGGSQLERGKEAEAAGAKLDRPEDILTLI